MGRLAEIRELYGMEGGKYEPNPNCKFCKGVGEKTLKNGRSTFCICLFIAPELSDFAGDALAETARKILEEMNNDERFPRTPETTIDDREDTSRDIAGPKDGEGRNLPTV